MFHITVAIARFFQLLLLDILKSVVGLVAVGFLVIIAAISGARGLRKLYRKIGK